MNKGLWTCSWPERRGRAVAWAGGLPWKAGPKSALSAAAKATPPITQNTTENKFIINPPEPVTAQDQSLCRNPRVGREQRQAFHLGPTAISLQVWSCLGLWPLACSGVNTVTLR